MPCEGFAVFSAQQLGPCSSTTSMPGWSLGLIPSELMTQLVDTMACHDIFTTGRFHKERWVPALPSSTSASSLEESETLSPKSYSRWKEQWWPRYQVFSEQCLFYGPWQGQLATEVRQHVFSAVTPPEEATDQGWLSLCFTAFLVCFPNPACEVLGLGVGWPWTGQLGLLLLRPRLYPREHSAHPC